MGGKVAVEFDGGRDGGTEAAEGGAEGFARGGGLGEELAVETGWIDAEVIGFVGGVVGGCATAVGAEEGFEAGEGFVELIGVAQGNLKEAELMGLRAARFGAKAEGDDGRFGGEIFQMRVKHSEESVHVARG